MISQQQINQIEEYLDNEYDACCWFGILKKDDKHIIGMYYNDMFGWAVSDCIIFDPREVNNIDDLLEEFDKWWRVDGKTFDDRFKAVPYPKNYHEDGDYSKVQAYFDANCKIRMYLVASIDSYCGREQATADAETVI
jgi:hypothetical protein